MDTNLVEQVKERIKSVSTIMWVILLYFVLSWIFVPMFGTAYNMKNILGQVCVLLIAACGQHFAVLNGGVDFSVTSVIALSGVVGASIMSEATGLLAGQWHAVPVALVVMVLIGLVAGVINGLSIITFKMPSFIVTLATQMIGSGLALLYTKSKTIGVFPDSFTKLGTGHVWVISYAFFVAIGFAAICHYILSRTKLGRQIYAIGNNAKAARISGVPIKKTIFEIYVISGLSASLAGIVMIAQMESAAPSFASNMFIDVMTAIIIGGTSPMGGRGKITDTLKGAFFVILLNVSMNLLGVSWFVISIIKGLIILLATTTDIVKKGRLKQLGVRK